MMILFWIIVVGLLVAPALIYLWVKIGTVAVLRARQQFDEFLKSKRKEP